MIYFIGAAIALGILVTIHEGGHFLAAKLCKVKVEKFSIGFGPKLVGFKKKETEYRLSLIPLGGYVKMKGENPDETIEDLQGSYSNKPWWQRAFIAFSGPLANFIFALLLFIFTFLIGKTIEDQMPVVGKLEQASVFQVKDRILQVNNNQIAGWSDIVKYSNEDEANIFLVEREGETKEITTTGTPASFWYQKVLPHAPAKIGEVSPGMPAYESGLKSGDEILAINGQPISNWYDLRQKILEAGPQQVELEIKRNNKVFQKKITPEKNILNEELIIGITQYLPVKFQEKYSLLESVQYGVLATVNFTLMNYQALFKLIAQPSALKENLGGPVMIISMSQQSAQKGWNAILTFIAAISLVLMIMNLLPIPILDGGHIIFCIIEAIKGSPLTIKTQMTLQKLGLFLLLMLMFFAFFNDFSRIFKRNASLNEQKVQQEQLKP
jgi:regulator of sigma E protease